MAANLWPQKLIELLDVAPVWPADVGPGDALVVNPEKDGFVWAAHGGQGEKGDPGDPGATGPVGPPNILSIGSVTSGPAAATITGTSPEQVLNLVLQTGATGTPGTNGTNGTNAVDPEFTIGGVGTGTPAVELTGVYPDLALNFTLPPGVPGDTGSTGPANTLTIGTVDVGATAAATITGISPNQVLNLTLPPGPPGIAGVMQSVTSATPLTLTIDETDPANPILSVVAATPLTPQIVEVTASRSLAPADEGKYLRSTSATAVSLTMPVGLALVDPAAEIHIRQAGAGLVTIVAASGVTINTPFGGTLVLAGQGATATLKKVAADEYDLFGLVEAAP